MSLDYVLGTQSVVTGDKVQIDTELATVADGYLYHTRFSGDTLLCPSQELLAKGANLGVGQASRVVVQEQGAVGRHCFAQTWQRQGSYGLGQRVGAGVDLQIDLVAELDQ